MSKTICVDARMLRASGIGTYLRNLLSAIKNSSSLSLQVIVGKAAAEDKELAGYDLILSSARIYSVKEQLEFFLKVPSCDIFWSPHYNIPLLPIRAQKRVVTIHDVFHLAYNSSLKIHERMYANVVIPRAVKKSDLIITDSYFSKKEIQKYTGAPESKIRVIHLGVDREIFSSEGNERHFLDMQKKYRIPDTFFLFVGNIKPHKNLACLIEAYKFWLKAKGKQVHLVVIGKAFKNYPLSLQVAQEETLRGQVHFLHDVDNKDLPLFYQKASVTVLPSFYEGFGLTPLEAMSCGCPTIVSHVASLPEICKEGSMYIDPQDPKTLFEALQKVWDDPSLRKDLKRRGTERVLSFKWETTVQKHLQLFEEL